MIIQTENDIKAALALLETSNIWSFDVETTGLSPRRDSLIGFGCASPADLSGFYIIMRAWENGQLVTKLTEQQVKPVIEKLAQKKLLGWNFSFDASFALNKFGIDLMPALHCEVMLAAHTCDENKFNYGLKQISAELFGSDTAAAQAEMKESILANGGSATEYYKANSELMAKYGLQDNILTCQNYLYWDTELQKQGLTKFFYEDEVMPLQREVTFYMQYNGIPVDVPALQEAQIEINKDMAELEDKIQVQIKPLLASFETWYINKHFPFKFSSAFKDKLGQKIAPPNWPRTKSGGYSFSKTDLDRASKKGTIDLNCQFARIGLQVEKPSPELILQVQLELLAESGTKYPFNLLSTDHLKRLFFTSLNEKALSHTEKGAPQINDEFLEQMAKKYTWAADLQVYRSLSKLRGTYIEGILEKQEDGIFYPQFFQHRTVSGRFGSNLQQLPRPIEHGPELVRKFTNKIRTFFIAGDGHTFVDDDYESLEPHIFAHVSGDSALQEIFNANLDFYSTIAIATEGLTGVSADKKASNYLGKVNKEARQKAKAYALGLAYGMSPYKLSFELGVSKEAAELLAYSYFKAYPELAKWIKKSRETACTTGQIKILSGRVRRFPELPRLVKEYGAELFDGLELWKKYKDFPNEYEKAKKAAGIAKNCVNNAANVQIQGYAAYIVNKASLEITRKIKQLGLRAYICASIHDEIIVRCEEKDVDTVAKIVQTEMENCVQLSVKLKAPASWGKTFAEAKGA